MGKYVCINKNILGLNLNQVRIYFTMKKWTNKHGICDLTLHQIAERSGVPYDTVIDNMTKEFYAAANCRVKKVHVESYKFRNIYHFTEKKFVIIKEDFLKVNADKKLKALVILLKLLCFKNSNKLAYNKAQLCELLNMSRPTLNKYLKAAIEAGLIKYNKNCIEITCAGVTASAVNFNKLSDGDKAYAVISNYCEARGVKAPRYNGRLVNELNLAWNEGKDNNVNYAVVNIIKRLNRCNIKVGKSYSLAYFLKVLLNTKLDIRRNATVYMTMN